LLKGEVRELKTLPFLIPPLKACPHENGEGEISPNPANPDSDQLNESTKATLFLLLYLDSSVSK